MDERHVSVEDVLLLVGLGVLVLVGVFANELANESWDLVQVINPSCKTNAQCNVKVVEWHVLTSAGTRRPG